MFIVIAKVIVSYLIVGLVYNVITYKRRASESIQEGLDQDSEFRLLHSVSPVWVDALVEALLFIMVSILFTPIWPLLLLGDIQTWGRR
jgi:hypothetical protein